MAHALPRFIAIKSYATDSGYYAPSSMKTWLNGHYVCSGEKNVFSPYAKIEVEREKLNNKFVHLRFCYSNKYWAIGLGAVDKEAALVIVDGFDQAEKGTITLEPTPCEKYGGHIYYFRAVQTQLLMGARRADSLERKYCLLLDGKTFDDSPFYLFECVDWDTLVIMPKYVAFKGYNNKYLRSAWFQGHEYLDFSSNDCGTEITAYEVTMKSDGHLRIKSKFFGKFWRRSPNWIWGDSSDDVGNDIDTLFWPVKVDDNTVALRSKGNNRFCSSLTTEGKTDCLNAAVPTITTEARLKVEELVLEREITDIVYRMDHARIFNEKPFVAGTGAATNNTQEPATLTIRVSYQDTSSHTFSNSLSIRTGVKTSIKTGFARIVEGKIEISFETTSSLEWNKTTTETKTAEATYQAVVPPMSRIKVNYVATQGTCNVPFCYTQRDKLSSDGSFVTTRNIDGVYTGVNYYSFHFEQNVVEVGMRIEKNTIESATSESTIESTAPRRCSACVFN